MMVWNYLASLNFKETNFCATGLKKSYKRKTLMYCNEKNCNQNEYVLSRCAIKALIIYMKKLLDSDWLRAMQFKCNTVQKVQYQCKLHIKILDYDWLMNNTVWSEPIISFVFKSILVI